MLTLRPYQQAAKAAVYEHLRARDDNPVVVIPTGGGKTPVIASLCADAVNLWNGRVLVLAHVKELLEQTADKLQRTCPELKFGIYSAGLNKRQTKEPVIVAGIQSVYQKACELDRFDLIVVDEAHLIPPDGEGMYRTFFADAHIVNPQVRVIGFTATPFRLKEGMICDAGGILNHVCFEVGVRELIRDGYLCPLVSKGTLHSADTSGVHIRDGEFMVVELEEVMDDDQLVQAACQEIVDQTRDRQSVLLFCSGVRHGQHVAATLRDLHQRECGFVCSQTPPAERDALLERFRSGSLKYLANVNVLTTGFDAPNVDCIVMLRPTLSPGLYYQMAGRGFRLHPGKVNCLILDFAGNVLRHGPVDAIQQIVRRKGSGGPPPVKECPECHSLIHTGYARCPDCGHQFPPPQRTKHSSTAGEQQVLSAAVTDVEYEVRDIRYAIHRRKGTEEAPPTLRVEYRLGLDHWISEFLAFEHTGYARQKAEQWWQQRSHDPVPETVEEALDLATAGALCRTDSVTVRSIAGEKYDRIVRHGLGEKPEPLFVGAEPFDPDDVPF